MSSHPLSSCPEAAAIGVLANTPAESGPDLDPILAVRRGQDASVTFHVKDERGVMVADCAVMIEELVTIFPQFRATLAIDSYFSVNSFRGAYRATGTGSKRRRRARMVAIGGLPRARRKESDAKYLNALYLDVEAWLSEREHRPVRARRIGGVR